MTKLRIALVTTIYSPFQVELAEAINALPDTRYDVIFTSQKSTGRGSHWTRERRESNTIHVQKLLDKDKPLEVWVTGKLEALKPQVVVNSGLGRAPTWWLLRTFRRRYPDVPTGPWLEVAREPLNPIKRAAQRALHAWQLRSARFILAIGDRSQAYYGTRAPRLPIHTVTYGADLSSSYAIERAGIPERPTFLFSGQLVKRNNIREMARAYEKLLESHPGRWRWIVGGKGLESPAVDALRRKSDLAAESVIVDADYETWDDRLRPFRNADVLVCPSIFSGWGLTIPEAMAAGMPVISSWDVAAARHYVRHERTGLMVGTDRDSIHQALARFVEDPAAARRMGDHARDCVFTADRKYVAERFREAVARYVHTAIKK